MLCEHHLCYNVRIKCYFSCYHLSCNSLPLSPVKLGNFDKLREMNCKKIFLEIMIQTHSTIYRLTAIAEY